MKKSVFVLLSLCLLLSSCGSPSVTTLKSKGYKIDVPADWKNVDKGEDSPHEVFLSPDEAELYANVKIQSQSDAKIQWGRVDEVTETYAEQAVEQFGYTLVSDKYQFVPQAQREQRYELVFSAVEQGQAFTIIQHIYAKKMEVIFVTGTYPENDEKTGNEVREILDSFLLAPHKGWEE